MTSLDIHEEHPRPQYLARLAHVKKKYVNFVTNTMEPRVPFWKVRLPVTIFSFSVVLLLVSKKLILLSYLLFFPIYFHPHERKTNYLFLQIMVAMAAVLGVVLYRMSVLTALYGLHDYPMMTSYAILLTTSTAAVINLCLIVVFNWIYVWFAEYLTEVNYLNPKTLLFPT